MADLELAEWFGSCIVEGLSYDYLSPARDYYAMARAAGHYACRHLEACAEAQRLLFIGDTADNF